MPTGPGNPTHSRISRGSRSVSGKTGQVNLGKLGFIYNHKNRPRGLPKEPRPVYAPELDVLGFDKHWKYDKQTDRPYIWAEANNYFYRGTLAAKLKGGNIYTAPEIIIPNGEDGNNENPQSAILRLEDDLIKSNKTIERFQKELSEKNNRIVKLEEKDKEITEECQLLRGQLHLSMQKAKLLGFELRFKGGDE